MKRATVLKPIQFLFCALLCFFGASEAHAVMTTHAQGSWVTGSKYRVGGFLENRPGRLKESATLTPGNAIGYASCVQEIASGRPYYCNGDPINNYDPDGRFGKSGVDAVGNGLLTYANWSIKQELEQVDQAQQFNDNVAAGHYREAASSYGPVLGGVVLSTVTFEAKPIGAIAESAYSLIRAEVAPVAAEEEALTLAPYAEGGGHHIPAKSAFRGDPNYNPATASAIPQAVLEAENIDHGAITGAQQILYRAYTQNGQSLTWEAMQSIETKALIKGGASPGSAAATVSKAINELKASGASPTRIPWGG